MDKVLKGPKLKYQVLEKNLGHFFYNRCTKYEDRICQIDGTDNKTETYGSVRSRTTSLALGLQRRGIRSNDVIAICSENTLDNIIPIIAALYLGTKVANVDPTLSVRHMKHLLCLVDAKIIFVQDSCLKLIEKTIADADIQPEVVVMGTSHKYSTLADFTKEETEDFYPADVDCNDGALMFFSSGTTGPSKAIYHSHRSYLELAAQACQVGWCDKVLHFSTFYWMTAMMILVGIFNTGSYRVFCRNATGEDIYKIIDKYDVKSLFMAPVLTYNLTRVENFQKYDRSSLRILTTGGTPIATSQIEKLREIFSEAQVSLLYGMTEMGIIAAFDPEEDGELSRAKIGGSGLPGPNVRLKVVDPLTGNILPPYQEGEICAASPGMMLGYYKTDSSQTFDKDNFLKTGDIGYYDENNCIYIVERLKEMFKYQSWHIIPSTLEGVLLEHPRIQEAVVFGIPHPEDGELPAACIVLKKDCLLGEEEIDEFLKGKVSDRERLRGGVTFMESLPQTPTGKVVRGHVRDIVRSLNK